MSYEYQLPASSVRLYKETRWGIVKGAITAHATWKCAYADLVQWLTIANGTLENVFNGVQRFVPLRFPDATALLATNVDVKLTGYDYALNLYSTAVIDVDFSTPQFDMTGQNAFLTENMRFGGNMITLPGSSYHFPSDSSKVNQDVGRFVPEVELNITKQMVPGLDVTTILSLTGKVNNAPFLGGAEGTVLFTGANSDRQTTATFVQSFQIQLSFMYRPVPWNQLCRPDGTGFEAVQDGGGNGIYQEADLTQLFN